MKSGRVNEHGDGGSDGISLCGTSQYVYLYLGNQVI